jgi:hypothetical protein
MNSVLLYVAHYTSKAQEWLGGVSVAVQERMFQYLLTIDRPRDMLYLKNGDWTYRSPGLEESSTLVYDGAKHCIRPIGYDGGFARYPWLIVVDEKGMDMSEFFSTLRVGRGHDIAAEKVLRLFVQQKRVIPSGKLTITKRNGDQIEVNSITGQTLPNYDVIDVSQVNFIK